MRFEDLGLAEPLLRAIADAGYTTPTPIQAQGIPPLLEGKDLKGTAQTGTGKTAAFSLPILNHMHQHPTPDKKQANRHARPIRALAVTPTRELAQQVFESFVEYGKYLDIESLAIYGGVRQGPQASKLKKGVDVLVATPGRLLDLMEQGLVNLHACEHFVLDEADRLLDMGFIEDIWRIVAALPEKRQTLLFSATMPFKIQTLANSIMHDPAEVRIAPDTIAAETVDQQLFLVEQKDKRRLLETLLSENDKMDRTLVFPRTKRGADRVTSHLRRANIPAEAIHSDKQQRQRERALENFRDGKTRVLVASDIASRGLDIDEVSHVVNYDMPNEAEVYVHRIGRTGRAGQEGQALSFCAMEERIILDEVEKFISRPIPLVEEHPFQSEIPRGTSRQEDKPVPQGVNARLRRPTRRRRL